MSDVVHKRLIGRRCNSLLVYEAHDSNGLVDGANKEGDETPLPIFLLGYDLR